ncbi:MAG TPA: zinc carboxypeptidase [Flavobacteriaceae bacterium]|jgi:hypothetical protein|nr:zinc carboxypeptidase [Flavobacteriaceae bacterium]HBS11091.1 zinc carboxypeptidase [Flavobacteriaceae bacterium]
MYTSDLNNTIKWASQYKEEKLFGRYVTFAAIEPILKNLPNQFNVQEIGHSHKGVPIYKINIGEGETKILIWTQMHGNESTGTKAVFDLFQWLVNADSKVISQLLKACTLVFVPMLNPDGAEAYTRVNAQNIDLNRDAVDLIAPESKLLNAVLKGVNPKFCFNLHDQRTIFSIDKKPASISFLAPSEEESRTVTRGREITMAVISHMFETLNPLIPGQIGRYTDEFYPTATGDNFQKAGHHTILIEAGHFNDDYDREVVRQLNFIALLSGITFIAYEIEFNNFETYFTIPNNEKKYLDIIYKNIILSEENRMIDVGVTFKEVLTNGKITFIPEIKYVTDLSVYNANQIIDKKGELFKNKASLFQLLDK